MGLSTFVERAFEAYYLLLFARVLFSWLRPRPGTFLAERVEPFLYAITEPALRPIRHWLRRYQGETPLDFSPLLLVIILSLAEALLLRMLQAGGL